ncbi:MAG: YicC family protein [Thermodesulfovibrionales bacterium]|nr:YicC family protein [Thermodesulfovibrionales bacterium]
MIQSMTGFGFAEGGGFKVEIRSVNHRHMEISIKLPTHLLEHDLVIRQMLKRKFLRGKFDVNVLLSGDTRHRVKPNLKLAKELYEVLQNLKDEFSIQEPISLAHLLIFREILLSEEMEYSSDELLQIVEEAINKLYEMRVRESDEIIRDILSILNTLKDLRDQIEIYSKDSINEHRDKLFKKITDLVSTIQIDEWRFSQEVAYIAQRLDINEELVRLKSHLENLEKVFVRKHEEEAVGKKLDFLSQEILRELNTVASKTDNIDIINKVIEMKLHIEKLREHAQNIQ